jgi:hypothetical protein
MLSDDFGSLNLGQQNLTLRLEWRHNMCAVQLRFDMSSEDNKASNAVPMYHLCFAVFEAMSSGACKVRRD